MLGAVAEGRPCIHAIYEPTKIIIIKYRPLFKAATDDMMQRTGSVDSEFPWHASIIAYSKPK